MTFRFFYTTLFSLLTFILYPFSQRDSLAIDPRWSYWIPREISNDHNWLLIDKIFGNQEQKSESYFIHTQTGQRVKFDFDSSKILLDHDMILLMQAPKWQWELVNLLNPTERTLLKEVKNIEYVSQLKRYVCFTTNNELKLYDYTKKEPQLIWSKNSVQDFLINPSKTTLLYRKGGADNNGFYILDLKTLQEKCLIEHLEELSNFHWTWNNEETAVAITLKDQQILFVDLTSGKSKTIELPASADGRTNLAFKFFDNNDLYIEHKINSKAIDKELELVDVWNGNARDLHLKNSWWLNYDAIRNDVFKAFVYVQEKDSLIELARNRKKEYLPIGIPNYILSYNPFEKDHNMELTFAQTHRYVLEQIQPHKILGELTTAPQLEAYLNRSPKGTAMVYPKGDFSELYDFETHQRQTIPYKQGDNPILWSSDSKSLFFSDEQNVIKYDIAKKITKTLTDFHEPTRISIQGEIHSSKSKYLDSNKPIVLSIKHQNYDYSLYSIYKNKLTKIIDHSPKKITLMTAYYGKEIKDWVWTEEDFDHPTIVMARLEGKEKTQTVLKSDMPEELYAWRKQKIISFSDKYGKKLKGLLYYPKDFDVSKKYPMITHIYDDNLSTTSDIKTFDMMSLNNPYGFNIPLLNANGYFVFLPETYVSEEGPGLSAVECVIKGIEAVSAEEPAINVKKLGLIGQSFGGYKSAFIVSQTNLFSAAVSGSGPHDLVNFYYSFNYLRNIPAWFLFEISQYGMKSSFGENPEKYLRNSTMNYAHKIKTPLLLYAGLKDTNVPWEHTRHLYIALKRSQLPTVAFFYKKEGHNLTEIETTKHFTNKTMDWFDYYLKDKKNISWITNGVDYNIY